MIRLGATVIALSFLAGVVVSWLLYGLDYYIKEQDRERDMADVYWAKQFRGY